MTSEPARAWALTLDAIDGQEAVFAAAFAAADIGRAGHLYHPDVVYLSPTTRLFGWPRRIVGRRQTLKFIDRTISGLTDIGYCLDERAVIPGGGAYTRILFDFGAGERRLRSVYVVVYRYRDGLIAQQELYYDPSDHLEDAPGPAVDVAGPPDDAAAPDG